MSQAAGKTRALVRRALPLAVAGVAVFFGLLDNFARPDVFGYLSFGRRLWTEPGFPWTDAYAYVPTKEPWIFNNWLYAAFAWPMWKALGPWSLQALRYALGFSAAGLLYRTARLRHAPAWAASAGLVLCSFFFWYAFPPVKGQVFTFFFFALVVYLLEKTAADENWRRLMWLPAISLLWTNLHAASIAGMGVAGLYAAGALVSGRRCLPFVQALLGMAAAGLINPYGLALWENLFAHAGPPDRELWSFAPLWVIWKSFDRAPLIEVFFLLLVFFLLYLPGFGRRDRTALLVLGATCLGGFFQVRHLPFFPLALAAYLPAHFAAEARRGRRPPVLAVRRGAAVLLASAAVVSSAWLLAGRAADAFAMGSPLALATPKRAQQNGVAQFCYPVDAVDYLERRLAGGNVLPERVWGPYITYRLYPRFKVGIDTRGPSAFPPEVAASYHRFVMGYVGWQDFLYAHPHDILALATGTRLQREMSSHPRWLEIYQDPCCTLLKKRP
ncbi:MAG: hypothetical protein JRI97_09150 [Deltaproteobacteria bacterium]|nr:hypothetical protein [Deltaproteobacteria bacterium]